MTESKKVQKFRSDCSNLEDVHMQVVARRGKGFKDRAAQGTEVRKADALLSSSGTRIGKKSRKYDEDVNELWKPLTCWISVRYFANLSLSAMVATLQTTTLPKMIRYGLYNRARAFRA
jgi:hypothetical protein